MLIWYDAVLLINPAKYKVAKIGSTLTNSIIKRLLCIFVSDKNRLFYNNTVKVAFLHNEYICTFSNILNAELLHVMKYF